MIRQAATTLQRPSMVRTLLKSTTTIQVRTHVVKTPGPDPLEVLRKECVHRQLCDPRGYRKPGVHWVFSVALSPYIPGGYPNLRTIGVQRVSPAGIEFVMKKGCQTAESLSMEQPLSVLYTQGKYVPGQSAEQWRGEGLCEKIDLEEVLHCLPHYTITGMVVSKQIELEGLEKLSHEDMHKDISVDRLALLDRSHVTELTQQTRLDLENDKLSKEDLDNSIQAFRFCPDRMERMQGGPDTILWDRWEWLRSSEKAEEGTIPWNEAKHLLPH